MSSSFYLGTPELSLVERNALSREAAKLIGSDLELIGGDLELIGGDLECDNGNQRKKISDRIRFIFLCLEQGTRRPNLDGTPLGGQEESPEPVAPVTVIQVKPDQVSPEESPESVDAGTVNNAEPAQVQPEETERLATPLGAHVKTGDGQGQRGSGDDDVLDSFLKK